MITYLNKILSSFKGQRASRMSHASRMSSTGRAGQVAVILLVVVTIALIAYAVTLNLGRTAEIKTITTIAANTGAAYLASNLASYAQFLSEQNLEGGLSHCGPTPALAAVIAIVVAILISIVTWGTGTAVAFGVAAAIIGIALSTVGLVIQLTYVQPTLTQRWNDIMAKTLDQGDQFLEQGISLALNRAVSDRQNVPDITDLDNDSVFGFDQGLPRDTIGRFSIYYNQRIQSINTPDIPEIRTFLSELNNLVYQNPGGFYDPDPMCNGTSGGTLPSECNPCCQPAVLSDGTPNTKRPACCDNYVPGQCTGDPTQCFGNSPYQDINAEYQHLYYSNNFVENRSNNDLNLPDAFRSFREELGRDDEIRTYQKASNDPNGQQSYIGTSSSGFRIEDATGFRDITIDQKPGIFSYLYKLADWGVDLNNLQPVGSQGTFGSVATTQCHWCYPPQAPTVGVQPPGLQSCIQCDPNLPAELRPQLDLSNSLSPPRYDPWDPNTPLQYNRTNIVDGTNSNALNPAGSPPLAADKVTLPSNILASETDCAQRAFDLASNGVTLNPPTPDMGFWKRGADRFCSPGDNPPGQWPYYLRCNKFPVDANGNFTCQDSHGNHVPCPCGEGGTDPTQFPEDPLDDIVYGLLPDIIQISNQLLDFRPERLLEVNFATVYDQFADLVEPPNPPSGGLTDPSLPCFRCTGEGSMRKLLRYIGYIQHRLEDWRGWREHPGILEQAQPEGYVGDSSGGNDACNEVWCVPPPGCPGVPSQEEATFDSNGNGVRGDLADVVACLNFNAEGYDYVNNQPSVGQGNDYRFQQCGNRCVGEDIDSNGNHIPVCENLPRSLVPTSIWQRSGYPGPEYYTPPPVSHAADEPQIQFFLRCFYGCFNGPSDQDARTYCPRLSTLARLSDGTLYNLPSTPFDLNACGAGWNQTNSWYQPVYDAVSSINPICAPDLDQTVKRNWIDNVRQSGIEAANQVIKFRHRSDFLNNRLREANEMIEMLDQQQSRLAAFFAVNGPANNLIRARINWQATRGLPRHVIYGWQDQPSPGRFITDANGNQVPQQGLWHLVKVEALIPSRCCIENSAQPGQCTAACSPGQQTSLTDQEIPSAPTETKWLELWRCYNLVNYSGVVKIRVTRYDQTRGTVLFPNGQPIWRFRYDRPGVSSVESALNDLSNCPSLPPPENMSLPQAYSSNPYGGAFLLNDSTDSPSCWSTASNILRAGISSETCAEYYWHTGVPTPSGIDTGGAVTAVGGYVGGVPGAVVGAIVDDLLGGENPDPHRGMAFQFVPCQNFPENFE